MRYKVPQSIDLEDKVIGPLTLKQFIYLLVGGMLDYILYKSQLGWIGGLLIFLISLVCVALAFVKVQGRDFLSFITYFIDFITSPKLYLWNKQVKEEKVPEVKEKEEEEEEDKLTKDPKKVRSRIQYLAEIVETHGWGHQDVKGRVVSEKQPEGRIGKSDEKKEGIKDVLEDVEPM